MKYVDPKLLLDKALSLNGNALRVTDVFGQFKELDLEGFSSIYTVGAGKAAVKNGPSGLPKIRKTNWQQVL